MSSAREEARRKARNEILRELYGRQDDLRHRDLAAAVDVSLVDETPSGAVAGILRCGNSLNERVTLVAVSILKN